MRSHGRGRRRWLIAGALPLSAVAVVVAVQPLWAFAGLARLFPGIVWRVPTSAPLVALTFDDGPAPDHTPELLRILETQEARATFFLIGERADAHPELVESIRAGGHEVANHYSDESSLLGVSDDELTARLLETEATLRLGGVRKLFRPPGGRILPGQVDLLRSHGYLCVLGSAYPWDAAHPPAWYIRWLITKNLAPGVIVILHDGIDDPSRSLAALPAILEAGRERGLRFVTVGALLDAAEAG